MSRSVAGNGNGNGNTGASTAVVVLAPLHVSCFVTAANRATPVFDVQLERRCVRVVTKPPPIHSTSTSNSSTTGDPTTACSTLAACSPLSPSSCAPATPTAEWEFHSVFATSASHNADFFREITQPALRSVLHDGVNTNILATGIHPTQKFRLLFGKSASSSSSSLSTTDEDCEMRDLLELHGQLGGLLGEFFHRHSASTTPIVQPPAEDDWKLGVSSWIVVNNKAVDLLTQPPPPPSESASTSTSSSSSSPSPLSFTSMEATGVDSALQIVQTAKTNRIVMKHTAEHSHFFVRLAFFQKSTGQLSTLHLVDLTDLKDFRDTTSTQEKHELYEILHEIRQQTAAMAASAAASSSATVSPKHKPRQLPAANTTTSTAKATASSTPKTMVLSKFLQPLLTQNARTFLYANVIDSRASLRESVALLNAVANVKGFACVCRKLTGIAFEQLGFQSMPAATTAQPLDTQASDSDAVLDSAAAKAMAAVAIGESLLHRLASGSHASSLPPRSSSPSLAMPSRSQYQDETAATTGPILASAMASPAVTSDAMSWLEAFKQRKKDILLSTSSPNVARRSSNSSTNEELPLGLEETSSPSAAVFPIPAPSRNGSASGDLYARLMETIQSASSSTGSLPSAMMAAPPSSSVRSQPLRRASSMPLPIEDPAEEDPLPPLPQPQPQPQPFIQRTSLTSAGTFTGSGFVPRVPPYVTRTVALDNMELPPQTSMPPPNVDGLDATTAARIQATDAALLRKNYDALLNVVREQQQLREIAETKAHEIVHDAEETRAQYEVQIENLKLDAVSLRSKVRALERQTGCAQVFDQYEAELQKWQREVQQLRMQNVELELRLASNNSSSSASGHGAAHHEELRTAALYGGGSFDASVTELKKKYLAVTQDKIELEQQLAEYRKKERHFQAQSKLISESTRKVDRLARELTEREEALMSTQLGKKRLSAEVVLAQQETQQLQQENERLLIEKAATTEELLAARMYLASVESEQKKAAILDKFVRKHGDRMQRLRGSSSLEASNNSSSSQWLEPESWRRDAQARECEEKLFQGVKRSVPQLVPLANKVLRKLELQELSLREYAEREVDFINLLVELASDQPAMALKAMIEEELNKISIY